MRYVVSACLAGVPCRYDGRSIPHPGVLELVRTGQALPVCPEVLGGLPVPRVPCERRDGRVLAADGADCSEAYLAGAVRALQLALARGCSWAILKARSPSCGIGYIYDGSFTRRLIPGDGVFAGLARAEGFTLMTEEEFSSFLSREQQG